MPSVSIFSPIPTSPEIRQALLAVYARRQEGVLVRRANASIGGWRPRPHYCFDNVEAWISHKPAHKPVLGYSYFNCLPWGLNFVRFVPHALVEVEDGGLVDITPHGASDEYPFIRHTGTRDEFVALVEHQGTHIGLDLILP